MTTLRHEQSRVSNQRSIYEPVWPQERFIVPLLRRKIERALAAYAVPAPPQGRLLDAGCGRQPFRSALESMGYSYTGVDAQQNLEGTVDVICALDRPLPTDLMSRAPFDFVLCTEVLEHVADWNAAFRNLVTLMAPGARLLVTCPHFYQLHEEPYDFWRPTLHALRYYGDRAGLTILDQEAAGDAWDVLGTLLANCKPAPASSQLPDRAAAKLAAVGHHLLFNALSNRRLQGMVHMHGPLYLSNIVVFEKP